MITEARATPAGDALARRAAALALEGFTPADGRRSGAFQSDPVWAQLRSLGTDLWLDTGDLDEARAIWTAELSSLTTNNTLVNKEVQKGIFDAVIGHVGRDLRAAEPGLPAEQLVYEAGFVLNCKNALRLVEAFDAHVSVELHPAFGDDVETSVAYGRRYYAVCPERFIVKVPMTAAGFLAARTLAREGIPVNYTLGFSARQNYLAARFSRTGWVNVFMGRLNAFVADNQLGDGKCVGEKATLATQRAVRDLRAQRGLPSRLIGASMRSAEQLYDLAGLDVFTMPTAAAREFHRQMTENPRPLSCQVDHDPEVALNPGISMAAIGLNQLWEIPESVVALADRLDAASVDGWTGEQVAVTARDCGAGALFPRWSAEDLRAIESDGKIPKYGRWKDRIRSGEVGLDALMSMSALGSFTTDQRQLDDRVRQQLRAAGVL